jgi:glycosyltransferase involved in cell wall biosynthesis
MFRRFAACLYVGAANYHYFRYHGVPSERLFFAPHAVDSNLFNADNPEIAAQAAIWRRELGTSPDTLVILFAGKLEEKKRPLDLLEAFRALNRRDVILLFVGSGPLEQELRSRAASMGNVRFAPFQNQTLMPRTYAAANLFVLPSFGPSETWGLAVNEAMSMAVPVVVSSHVGCAEDLVAAQQTGLVFEAGDRAALTQSLSEALSDRTRLRDWGAAGRKAIQAWNYERATAGLFEALNGLNGATNR